MRLLPAILVVVALLLPPPAAAGTSEAYQQARLDYFALRKDEKRKRFRHHWMKVIPALERGAEKLQGDDRCGATFNAGRAWHDVSEVSLLQEDRERAMAHYARLETICPKSSLVDDALLHTAELQRRRDEVAAASTLQRLLESHGQGDRVGEARELLASLSPAARAEATRRKERAAAEKRAAAERAAAEKRAAERAAAEKAAAEKRAAERAAAERAAEERRAAADANAAQSAQARAATAPSEKAAPQEGTPGAHLPSAHDILAALDARGADAHRPEDRALEEDLRRDRLAREGKTDNVQAMARTQVAGGEIPLSVIAGLKVRRVVIDPGHGGKDTGAIGKKGTREKDLTLAISRKLKRHLEEMGLEVLLTRDSDVFLELEERTAFANKRGADLFISVHVNAAENRRAYGIETYTLNINSDRYAARLAARENATSRRGVGDLEFILADLATKANTDDSVRLARAVQGEMVRGLRRHWGEKAIRDLGVKQALFYVLVGARMPAILVEASFVSHPEEEKRLRTERYQEETARGIAEGVRRYLAEREALAQGGAASAGAVF